MCPLIRYCSAARRRSSSASAARSAGDGVEVGLRRLGAAPRVDERVAELDVERPPRPLPGSSPQLEREAIEPRRAIERERLGCALRRRRRILGGALRFARFLEVQRERLGIGAPEPSRAAASRRWCPLSSSRESSATTVSRIRSWYGSISLRSREARVRIRWLARRSASGAVVALEAGGVPGERGPKRLAGHGEDLEQPARAVGQPRCACG